MNTTKLQGGEAVLRYLDADFEIIKDGRFVRCAVSAQPIPIKDLRYWSVDRQEPYADAAIANRVREEALANGEGF
jgi:hypothetical protein